VLINGARVLSLAPYCQTQTLDVTNWLKRGDNNIAIQMSAVSGPPAIALSLVVTHHTGPPTILLSDDKWNAADLGPVPPEFWGVGRRGIELSPFENYEHWQQAKTDSKKKAVPKFWTVPGFEVTELRIAQADEGSWISLAFDPQGRMIISREDQGFLRMTLDEPRKSISRVEAIASDLKECRGLAYDGDWLYASANNSLGLYRLQIDAEGKVQKQERLREFPGKVGHGRNDIVFGRGNRTLYQIHGDSVELPTDNFRDLTSPLNESKTKKPGREGSLLRCDANGDHWELICAGLRNPYGIDLHRSGAPFTFDADNEHDMGTPWYRPTRILHLMTGGDTGYRESTGVLPPRFHDQPDHAPPVIDIGRSSPTSVMFGYDLKFPEPYKNALFALDWTYGRVIAVHLAPRGESFRAATELFLQGRPLNVTDVAAGPDGDMYLITGGRKTQSALYRISYVGKAGAPAWRGNHEPEAVEFLQRKRNQMDSFPFLTADPAARHRARIELERGDLDRLRQLIESAKPSIGLPQLVLQLALARARRNDDVPLLLNSLKECELAQLDLSQQFAWLRVVGLCRETAPELVAGRREVLVDELVSLAKTLQRDPKLGTELRVAPEGTSDELRRRVVLLLGESDAAELPEIATTQLFQSSVQEDQLAGLLATRDATKGWTLDSRREQLRVLNEIPRMVGGAGLPPFEKWLRPLIVKTLSKEEALALADVIEPKIAVASEPLPPPRKHVQKWTLDDLATLHAPEAPAGDAAKGATLFLDALCSRCHRVNLKGAAVGPDLTHVSRRFSRRDILESIVQPSLAVAENFRMETVLTEAGKVYTGRVINEGDYRSEKLTLQIDPLQPDKIVELDKKEITEHRTLPVSPMPDGLLDTFTLEEIRNLLAYLAP
jgi:putative heme-binding domain-containing protein